MKSADDTAGAALPASLVQTSAQPASPPRKKRPAANVLPRDEFHGLGGDYVLEGGVRRLVVAEPAAAAAAAAAPAATDTPAEPETPAA